jgi:hypothetical protein
MSCKDLGGKSLGSRKEIFWKPISQNLIAAPDAQGKETGGFVCVCRWRPLYEQTTTACQRDIEEAATIDGRNRRRIRNIIEEIPERKSIIISDATTFGPSIMVGSQDCLCNPPQGGQIARD